MATIQVPTLSARTTFYRENEIHLIWIMWDFDPYNIRRISIRDTYVPNRRNAFSMDDETIAESANRGVFVLRVHWPDYAIVAGGAIDFIWRSQIVSLEDLKYSSLFSPYFIDPDDCRAELEKCLLEKREKFRSAWIDLAQIEEGPSLSQERRIVGDILNFLKIELEEGALNTLVNKGFRKILNFLSSLESGKIIGSRLPNISAVMNDILIHGGQSYWVVIESAVARYKNNMIIKSWYQSKIEKCQRDYPVPDASTSIGIELIWAIFPDVRPLSESS